MKKNVVRGLALALVILMCLSLLPLAAHAEEHIHNFAPTTIAPSCSQNGYVQMICEACGMGGEIISWIEPTGAHHFESIENEDYLIEKSDDYCLKPSVYWKSCVNYIDDQGTVCGASAEEAYDKALENLYNQLNERKNSGEEADWEKIIKDAIVAFDDQYKFTVGGEGHAWVEHEAQVATCTSDGWTAYRQCANCGELAGYEVIPAKGHRWGELKHIADPTCTEDGSDTHVCEVCDLEETIVLPALGHRYGEYKVTREATCTVDGERERTCSVCGYVDKEIIPAGHKYGEFTVIKEPGCYEEGLQERVCTVCGEKDIQPIPAAHKFGAFTVTMEPTCYSTGEKRATCTVCGEEVVEWIDMAHKYENGVCVFCGIAAPETTDAAEAEEETVAEVEEETVAEEKLEIVSEEAAADEIEVVAQSFELDGQTIYMVKLLPNGGSGDEMDPVVGPEGYGPVTLPECGYTREGYTFTGWNAAADGSGADYDTEYTVHANEILYAQWKSNGTESEDSGEKEDSNEKEEALSVSDTKVFDNPGEDVSATDNEAFESENNEYDVVLSMQAAIKFADDDNVAILSNNASENVITAHINRKDDTNDPKTDIDPSLFNIRWIREDNGVETEIPGANGDTYRLRSDDLNKGIICTISEKNTDKEAARSFVLLVRKQIPVTFFARGLFGSAQYTVERTGEEVNTWDLTMNENKTIQLLTNDKVTVSIEAQENDEGYCVRRIAIATPTSSNWTNVRDIEKGNANEAYEFTVTRELYVLLQVDKPNLYNEDTPTTTADKALDQAKNADGNKPLILANLLDKLEAEKYTYRYITPIWWSDGFAMNDAEIGQLKDYLNIQLDVPSGYDESTDDLLVFHYDYNASDWKKVGKVSPDKDDSTKITVNGWTEYTPFCVVAVPQVSVTETVLTFANDEEKESTDGSISRSESKEEYYAGDQITNVVTPNDGFEVKCVRFNGEETKANADGTYTVTLTAKKNPNPNTVEAVFKELPKYVVTEAIKTNGKMDSTGGEVQRNGEKLEASGVYKAYDGEKITYTVKVDEAHYFLDTNAVKANGNVVKLTKNGEYTLTVDKNKYNSFIVEFTSRPTIEETVKTDGEVGSTGGTVLRNGEALGTQPYVGSYGEKVKYTITANEHYFLESVKFNDKDVEVEDGACTVTIARGTADNKLEVVFTKLPTLKETITVDGEEDSTGGEVLRNGEEIGTGTYEGQNGEEITYTVTANEDHIVSSVKFNGEDVEPTDGEYSVTLTTEKNPEPSTFEVDFAKITDIEKPYDTAETERALKKFLTDNKIEVDESALWKKVKDVTPVWSKTKNELTREEIAEAGGYSFDLAYPEDVKLKTHVIWVLHYNGSEWVELTEGVDKREDFARITTKDFSPFAVIAVKKDVTIQFYDGENYLGSYVKDINAISGREIILPDGAAYAKTQDKAFGGWYLDSDPNTFYKAGAAYTPYSNDEGVIYFRAKLRNGVTITFHSNNGKEGAYKQTVVSHEASNLAYIKDIIEATGDSFIYDGHTFKEWNKKEDGTGTAYKDRAKYTAFEDTPLYAQWYDREAPAAPDTLNVTRSIINYDAADKDNTAGVISGTSNMMEYYIKDGTWKECTGTSLVGIPKPGDYEFRYAEAKEGSTTFPPSEIATVTVHQYFTEKTTGEPLDLSEYGITQDQLEDIYADAKLDGTYVYDVTLYEIMPNGETKPAPEGKTVLNEDVGFKLAYPEQTSMESNTYELYNLDDGTEIEIDPRSDAIYGTTKQFGTFVLFLNSKLNGTVNLDNTEPKAGETVTATVSNPTIGKSKTKYDGKLEYRWVRVDQDGNPTEVSAFATDNNTYKVTGKDLMYTLKCEVRCEQTGVENIPKNTIDAETKQVKVKLVELYTLSGYYSTDYLGFFDGVTEDMEVSYDGRNFEPVTTSNWGTFTDGNKFLVKNSGVYQFRYNGELDSDYWDGDIVEGWYLVGYTINTSYGTDNSGSGTVTVRNGSTTLTSSSTITVGGETIIKPYGTNHWLVKAGATTDLHIVIRPSGSSSSSSSSSSSNNNNNNNSTSTSTYAHVSLNGRAYTSFNSQREYSMSPVTFNQEWTVVFNRSSSSPRTADVSNLGLWSALCFLSVVGMGTVCGSVYKRKKAQK